MKRFFIIAVLIPSLIQAQPKLKKEDAPVKFLDSVIFSGNVYHELLPAIVPAYLFATDNTGITGKVETTSEFSITKLNVDTLKYSNFPYIWINSDIISNSRSIFRKITSDTITGSKLVFIADTAGYRLKTKILDYGNIDRVIINGRGVNLTNNLATTVFQCQILPGNLAGGQVKYSIVVINSENDLQVLSGHLQFAAVNKYGTPVAAISEVGTEVTAKSTGTLTDVWSAVVSNNLVQFKVLAASSLPSISFLKIYFEVFQNAPGEIQLP